MPTTMAALSGQQGGQNDDTKSQAWQRGGLIRKNRNLKVQRSANMPRPCPTGGELLAEQFRSAATVARAILDLVDLVRVKSAIQTIATCFRRAHPSLGYLSFTRPLLVHGSVSLYTTMAKARKKATHPTCHLDLPSHYTATDATIRRQGCPCAIRFRMEDFRRLSPRQIR